MVLSAIAQHLLVGLCLAAADAGTDAQPTGVIHLFNGKNLDGLYVFIKGRGRDNDPLKVFTIHDGLLHISGQEFGCVTTVKEYENYRLIAEFKWGDATHPPRKDRARDSGILLHSVGQDGAYGGVWMHSIERRRSRAGATCFNRTASPRRFMKGGSTGSGATPRGATSRTSAASRTWKSRSASGTAWSASPTGEPLRSS
jgi:hypothetical protein